MLHTFKHSVLPPFSDQYSDLLGVKFMLILAVSFVGVLTPRMLFHILGYSGDIFVLHLDDFIEGSLYPVFNDRS